MPRSILPILCTLTLVPALLWLGGAVEIGSGLLRALPSVGLAWLWWVAARGYGHWLLPGSSDMGPVVGVVGLVFLDQCLGRLGLMDLTSSWGLLALGLLGYRRTTPSSLGWPQMEWTWMLPLAVLGTAALVPPGWLWDTEFGGYDVLSYHLALPADWWTLGRMGPLTTNAYSGLPGGAESAFLHLHALSGGTHDVTGLAAQMLCAILVIHTASLLHHKNAAAALVFLMTPWVMVTGSMAYTEAFVILPACAIFLHLRESQSSPQACCLGLLAGGIALAKPSAALLLALPLAVLFFAAPNRRSLPVRLAVRWYCPHRVYALAAGQHDHRWLPIFPIVDWTLWLWTMDRNPKCQLGGGPYRWWFSFLALDRVVGLSILWTLAMECDTLAGSGWAGHGTKE